ncbi:MAG: hypothetical protein ACYDBJ_00250 [Aggregatilineales bacterium]
MNNRSIKSLSMSVVIVLIAAFAALPSSTGTRVALADSGGERGHDYEIMFTKWITSYPNMVGIVTGGDAGAGTFAGQVLKVTESTPQIWKAAVLYQIFGTAHSFSAHIDVTENDVTNRARLVGKVTDGWLKGWPVYGGYIILPASSCPHPEFGSCYQVTLRIHVGAED